MNDLFFSLMMLGAVSTSDGYLPFWMTANQYGLMPESSGGLAIVKANTQFDESKTVQFRWGASLATNAFYNKNAKDDSRVNGMIDELYASLKWKKLTLDLGQKHRDMDFLGADVSLGSLSTTSGHIIESGNARSMPGYLATLSPVIVPWTKQHLYFFCAYGDYFTTDNRYMDGALVHNMRLGLEYKATSRLSFSFVLDHFAMWGGKDTTGYKMDINFKNYVKVITGRGTDSSGSIADRNNTIGNQLGSETFRVDYKGDGWKATAQHDAPYDDKSGMIMLNFPDGVNTLAFSWDDKNRWISDIVYEHQYTMYQSGPMFTEHIGADGYETVAKRHRDYGVDNYFFNIDYMSGWTHYGRTIGDPFILPAGVHAGYWTSAHVSTFIENNRLKAHHVAISGKLFRKQPYKLMLTYSKNYGNYTTPYKGESAQNKKWGSVHEIGLNQFSSAFVGIINASEFKSLTKLRNFSMVYGLYLDAGELYDNNFGVSLGVKYSVK